MANTTNVSPKGAEVLKEVLESLQNNDDALESHLPKEIYELDKPALLAVIYRVLAYVK